MEVSVSFEEIVRALNAGTIRFTIHAFEQMNRRRLTYSDVVSIAHSCSVFKWQENKKSFLVTGYAMNGKGAAFSCKKDHGFIIITVMWRHLAKDERTKK